MNTHTNTHTTACYSYSREIFHAQQQVFVCVTTQAHSANYNNITLAKKKLTQKELLLEACKTEEINRRSLRQMLQLQEINNRKAMSESKNKKKGPRIIYRSTRKGDTITFSDGNIPEVESKRPIKPVKPICAITKKRARYFDPLTQKPYADLEAFKKLRQKV